MLVFHFTYFACLCAYIVLVYDVYLSKFLILLILNFSISINVLYP